MFIQFVICEIELLSCFHPLKIIRVMFPEFDAVGKNILISRTMQHINIGLAQLRC